MSEINESQETLVVSMNALEVINWLNLSESKKSTTSLQKNTISIEKSVKSSNLFSQALNKSVVVLTKSAIQIAENVTRVGKGLARVVAEGIFPLINMIQTSNAQLSMLGKIMEQSALIQRDSIDATLTTTNIFGEMFANAIEILVKAFEKDADRRTGLVSQIQGDIRDFAGLIKGVGQLSAEQNKAYGEQIGKYSNVLSENVGSYHEEMQQWMAKGFAQGTTFKKEIGYKELIGKGAWGFEQPIKTLFNSVTERYLNYLNKQTLQETKKLTEKGVEILKGTQDVEVETGAPKGKGMGGMLKTTGLMAGLNILKKISGVFKDYLLKSFKIVFKGIKDVAFRVGMSAVGKFFSSLGNVLDSVLIVMDPFLTTFELFAAFIEAVLAPLVVVLFEKFKELEFFEQLIEIVSQFTDTLGLWGENSLWLDKLVIDFVNIALTSLQQILMILTQDSMKLFIGSLIRLATKVIELLPQITLLSLRFGTDLFDSITEVLPETLELVNALVDLFEAMQDWIPVIETVIGLVTSFTSAVSQYEVGGPSILQQWLSDIGWIPAAAEGGIVASPTILLAGEAGPEAIIPLDQYNSGGDIEARLYAEQARDELRINNALLKKLIRAIED